MYRSITVRGIVFRKVQCLLDNKPAETVGDEHDGRGGIQVPALQAQKGEQRPGVFPDAGGGVVAVHVGVVPKGKDSCLRELDREPTLRPESP